jgi:hypothetical protein
MVNLLLAVLLAASFLPWINPVSTLGSLAVSIQAAALLIVVIVVLRPPWERRALASIDVVVAVTLSLAAARLFLGGAPGSGIDTLWLVFAAAIASMGAGLSILQSRRGRRLG